MKERNFLSNTENPVRDTLNTGTATKLFKIMIAFLGAFAFCKLLSFAVNALFFGTVSFGDSIFMYATRETSMVWSWWGYAFVGLLDLAFAAICIYSLVCVMKAKDLVNGNTSQCYSSIQIVNRIVYIESILAMIDGAIIVISTFMAFFFPNQLLPFSEKTITFLKSVSDFCDIPKLYSLIGGALGIGNKTGMSALLVLFLIAFVIAFYYLVRTLTVRKTAKAFEEFVTIYDKSNADVQTRVFKIIPYVFTATNALWAIALFINGSFIAGLVTVSGTGFILTASIFAYKINKSLRASIEA